MHTAAGSPTDAARARRPHRFFVRGFALVALAALLAAAQDASALNWQSAPGLGAPSMCLADADCCAVADSMAVPSACAPAAEDDSSAASPNNVAPSSAQENGPIGESIALHIDSGPHTAGERPSGSVFDDTVEVEGAPWVRLRFEEVVLAPGDRIEIRTGHGPDALEVLKRRDFVEGRGASGFLRAASVSVALFLGRGAHASRFVVTEVEYGYAGDSSLAPLPRETCDLSDARSVSADLRVCLLLMGRDECDTAASNPCGCPRKIGEIPGACVVGQCEGGSRDGKLCGQFAACGGNLCKTKFYTGTAFFIERGDNKDVCLLTAGHNMFRRDTSHPDQQNRSTELLCEAYGCGEMNGFGIDCDMTTHRCPAGPKSQTTRPSQWCTDQTHAGITDRYDVIPVDGEYLSVGAPNESDAPHDWALLKIHTRKQHDAFALTDAYGTFQNAKVIGHGADTGPVQMDAMQQSASGIAIRDDESDVIAHFIDTKPGNSGSPLLLSDDSVLGIHVEGPPRPLECRTEDHPNHAVYVHHTHAAGEPGRALEPALAQCRGAGNARVLIGMNKRVRETGVGSWVEYEIKLSGHGLEIDPSTLTDVLPPELVFESVRVEPPQVLLTPNPVVGADRTLSLDLGVHHGTILVYVRAHILRSVPAGTVVKNRAEILLADGTRGAAQVKFRIPVVRGGGGLSLLLDCPGNVAWFPAPGVSADVFCTLTYGDVSDPGVAGNSNQLTLDLPVDATGSPIFQMVPAGLAGGVLDAAGTRITWTGLAAPRGTLRIRGVFVTQPAGLAKWSATLTDNSAALGVRKLEGVTAATRVGVRFGLAWRLPPTVVNPGATRAFQVVYSGLLGTGKIEMDFCAQGQWWEIVRPVTFPGMPILEQKALQVNILQGCLLQVENLAPTANAKRSVSVAAKLNKSAHAGQVRLVTSTIADSGRAVGENEESISLEVSTR